MGNTASHQTMRKGNGFLWVLRSIWRNWPLLLRELTRVENFTLEVVFTKQDDKTGKHLADFPIWCHNLEHNQFLAAILYRFRVIISWLAFRSECHDSDHLTLNTHNVNPDHEKIVLSVNIDDISGFMNSVNTSMKDKCKGFQKITHERYVSRLCISKGYLNQFRYPVSDHS